MMHMNYLSIVAAAVAVVVFASVYYILLARQRAVLSPAAASGARPPGWMLPMELAKSLLLAAVVAGLVTLMGITNLLAAVVAGLVTLMGITNLVGAIVLGLALWLAFPVVLLAGSVAHENVPWRLGAIHSGDWLAKLLIISVIVTVWR